MQIKPLDLLPRLASELWFHLHPQRQNLACQSTSLSTQQLVRDLEGCHSQVRTAPDVFLEDPIYFQTRVGFESPDAMIFTSLGLGDKGAFVHLAPQMPLMGPLPTTHHVPQRLWSTK